MQRSFTRSVLSALGAAWCAGCALNDAELGTVGDTTSVGSAPGSLISDAASGDVEAPWGDATLAPDPATIPETKPSVLCELSGPVGAVIECPVVVLRATQKTPPPVGFRADLFYPGTVQPVGLIQRSCVPRPGIEVWEEAFDCTESPLLSGQASRTGHTVALTPPDPRYWDGGGRLEVVHETAPDTALSAAYLAGSQLAGVAHVSEATPVSFRFVLRAAISAEQPVQVLMMSPQVISSTGSPVALKLNGIPVAGSVYRGGVVAAPADCTALAGVCDDGSDCTEDFCNPVTRACVYTETPSATCNDGNACTQNDSCKGSVCVGELVGCDDGDPCTVNVCVPATGCSYNETVLKGAAGSGLGEQSFLFCPDAQSWTDAAAACVKRGRTLVSFDSAEEAGFVADSANRLPISPDWWIGYSDAAVEGTFQWSGISGFVPWSTVPTSNSEAADCVSWGGYPTLGQPVFANVLDCAATKPFVCERDCDDLNPCTDDTFDAAAGKCVYTPNVAPCNDGNLCTEGDACASGVCTAGKPKDCNDQNPCTTDTCTPAGLCANTITQVLQRQGELYTYCEEPSTWADAKAACTKLSLGLATLYSPAVNTEVSKAAAAMSITNWWTGLNDQDTEGVYQWADGKTVSAPGFAAGEASGSTAAGEDCGGVFTGATNSGQWFDRACTDKLAFICGTRCDDGNPCTYDQLDSSGKCVSTPAPFACDDKNPCTIGDFCDAGACVGGGAANCSDGDPCTTDTCDPIKGCQFAPPTVVDRGKDGVDTLCLGLLTWSESQAYCQIAKGNLGTTPPPQTVTYPPGLWVAYSDQVQEGKWDKISKNGWIPGAATLSWAPGEPTNGPPERDCMIVGAGTNKNYAHACSDKRGFICRYSKPALSACQSATFDPMKGWVVTNAADGTTCDDKDVCTVEDRCTAGKCGGKPNPCEDNDACTEGTCRPGKGCEYKRNWFQTGFDDKVGYLYCKEPLTWNQAINACEKYGHNLFTPESNVEMERVGLYGYAKQPIHLGITDSGIEGKFIYWEVGAKPFDPVTDPPRKCALTDSQVTPWANTEENDFGYMQAMAGIAVGRTPPGPPSCFALQPKDVKRPFVCKRRCSQAGPRDWVRYDSGTCAVEHRIVVRQPKAPPAGVTADSRYTTEPVTYRVMPPATAPEARAGCAAIGETQAPWWVNTEPERADLKARFGIDRLWTPQTWKRRGPGYSPEEYAKSLPSNPNWANFDSGWGVPPTNWCGFDPANPNGVGSSAWPGVTFDCSQTVQCPHPYASDWYGTKGTAENAKWWMWGGQPASGPNAFLAHSIGWFPPLETSSCLYGFGKNAQGEEETRDDCWRDGCMDAQIGSCVNKRTDCLEKRPYLCEMGTAKWQLKSGPTVTAPFHPCGNCDYWDAASSTCKRNVVALGNKYVLACSAVTAVDNATDFQAMLASDFGSFAKACGAVSYGNFPNVSIAKLSIDDARKVQAVLGARQFQGAALGIGPYFPADKYQEYSLFDEPSFTECTLIDGQGGLIGGGPVPGPCIPLNQQPPNLQDGKAVIYKVLCETTCPASAAGACFTPAIDPGMNCTGTAQQKDKGVACDDGNPCTTSETCDATGQCLGGKSTVCPGNACNPAACVPGFGCVSSPVACDDNNACTVDSCAVENGKAVCKHQQLTCPDDGNACTIDTCVQGFGCYQVRECDDLNPCTADVCDAAAGCQYPVDPDSVGSPGCGAPKASEVSVADPKCVERSADKKRLTITCLPGDRVLWLDAAAGTWVENTGKATVKDDAGNDKEVEFKKYVNGSPLVLVGSPSLKLPGGTPGIPLPGAILKVTATNPPAIQGTLLGLPGMALGPLQGFGSGITAFPDSPLKLAFAPAKFLQEKYFDEDDPKWCAFDLPSVKDVCDQLPKPPKLPLPEDSMWFSIVWDASAIGVEFDVPGLEDSHSLQAPAGKVKKKALAKGVSESAFGKVGVLFDPFDPGLYVSLADFPMLSDVGIEAGALGLSWKGQLEMESILPVRLVKQENGQRVIVKEVFKATGNFYAMATVSLVKFLKVPLVITGELLVGLDPNKDGPVLLDTIKAIFTGGEVPSLSSGTDKDFSVLTQARVDVKLGFGDISPRLEKLGEIAFTVGKAVMSLDTRPDVPQAGLRVAGKANLPSWPGVLGWFQPEGEVEAELWLADAQTFGFEVKGVFKILKVLSDLSPTMNGHLIVSSDEIKLDATVTFFGQNLAVNGWIDASTGAFELCTAANIGVGFGPLPNANGRACLGSHGILAKLRVGLDATLSGFITKPLQVAKSVMKTIQEWSNREEKQCGWNPLSWGSCIKKVVSYVVNKVISVIEYVTEWVNENLNFGAQLTMDLDAMFAWGFNFPDIRGQLSAKVVWPGGSYDVGSLGVSASSAGITVHLPSPIPTFCIKLKQLSVSMGECQ
ncbi:MAG: hypothetical protein IV100_07600 [Myxococcales bacterium]|nr:hypothetical protein [Myxococcales bacterium]